MQISYGLQLLAIDMPYDVSKGIREKILERPYMDGCLMNFFTVFPSHFPPSKLNLLTINFIFLYSTYGTCNGEYNESRNGFQKCPY